MSRLSPEVSLREHLGCVGVCLEDADAVFLVKQKVKVACAVASHGIELAMACHGTQSGKRQLLSIVLAESGELRGPPEGHRGA